MRCPESPFPLGCRPPLNTATGLPMREDQAMCWLDSIPGARGPAGLFERWVQAVAPAGGARARPAEMVARWLQRVPPAGPLGLRACATPGCLGRITTPGDTRCDACRAADAAA